MVCPQQAISTNPLTGAKVVDEELCVVVIVRINVRSK